NLSANGYATLRFDKRGFQPECQGPMIANYIDLTPEVYIQDIRNIIAFIAHDLEMSALPLVLLGHSEGVNFVTEIAAQGIPNLKSVILLAGLGKYAIDETLLRQFRQTIAAPNASPDMRQKAQELLDDGIVFFAKIRGGTVLPTDTFM